MRRRDEIDVEPGSEMAVGLPGGMGVPRARAPEGRSTGPPHSYPADDLAARVLAGDVEAVGRVSRWSAQVLGAPRFGTVRVERHDLQQEVMVRLLASLRRGLFDPRRDLRTYVQGIAQHVAIGALVRHRPESTAEVLERDLPVHDEESRRVAGELVRRVLERVTPECRFLIRGYFLFGHTYADLASTAGLPMGTVKSRLHRCVRGAHRLLRSRRAPRRKR